MARESSIKSRSPIAAHPVTSAVIAVLTIAVIFFAVYVPLYARATPKVGDFPFFYFYLARLHARGGDRVLGHVLLQKRVTRPGPDWATGW